MAGEYTSRKTQVEVAHSGKTMAFYESIVAFPKKYPKTLDFDHSNYRLFERILAVTSTSNNRGLTVIQIFKYFPKNIFYISKGLKILWKMGANELFFIIFSKILHFKGVQRHLYGVKG